MSFWIDFTVFCAVFKNLFPPSLDLNCTTYLAFKLNLFPSLTEYVEFLFVLTFLELLIFILRYELLSGRIGAQLSKRIDNSFGRTVVIDKVEVIIDKKVLLIGKSERIVFFSV